MVKKKKKTKPQLPKRPVGRPTKYKPEYCQELIDYMLADGKPIIRPMNEGGTIIDKQIGFLPHFFEGFARKLEVHHGTLLDWCEKHEEFSDAYKKAKEIQLEKMTTGAMAGTLIPSTTIFALKNMFGWRDKKEISGDPKSPVEMIINKKYGD